MKYLKFFESWEDPLKSDVARDLLGLTYTRDMEIGDKILVGPLENQAAADLIADEIDDAVVYAYKWNDRTGELDDPKGMEAAYDAMAAFMQDPEITRRLSEIGYKLIDAY